MTLMAQQPLQKILLKIIYLRNNLNLLHLEKERVLNDYNLHNRICKIIDNSLDKSTSGNVINQLHSSGYFWNKVTNRRKKIKRIYREG